MISAENISGPGASNAMAKRDATFFGVPIGRLGLLPRIMMSGACAFITFFIAFVLAIIGVSIYDSVSGVSMANLNIAYLYIAAPIGILALAAGLIYLVGGWARGKFSGAQ